MINEIPEKKNIDKLPRLQGKMGKKCDCVNLKMDGTTSHCGGRNLPKDNKE